jgi:hypothetical protein
LETVSDRKASTLLPIIQRYIQPGTEIHSDCWAAYNGISSLPEGYTHLTVNHRTNFVDPETGAYTHRFLCFFDLVKNLYVPKRRMPPVKIRQPLEDITHMNVELIPEASTSSAEAHNVSWDTSFDLFD